MKRQLGFAVALAAVSASPLAAQRWGSLEIGAFGQYTFIDEDLQIDDAFGGGARVGLFPFRNVSAEGSIGFAPTDGPAGADTYRPMYVHLLYHAPFGNTRLIFGGGYVNNGYIGNTQYNEYEDGVSALVGLGFPIGSSRRWQLRVDGLYDYMPSPGPNQVGRLDASSSNITLRAGISWLWRRGEEAAAPVAPPVVAPEPTPQPTPQPTPEPTPQPQPPAQPTVDSAAITAEVRRIVSAPVYFDFDRSNIRPDAAAALDQKIPIFQANPTMRIRISGHADSRGSDEYNVALGQRRANAAREYLIQRGIDAARIDVVSYGEERPAVPNATTEEQHQQNRRDEFEIIAGGPTFTMPGQ